MSGCVGKVRSMEQATENRDLWEEIVTKIKWSRRISDLPADRHLMPRESVLKLRELVYELTGEDDPQILEGLVFGTNRSHRYVTARVNSLYAFRHLTSERFSESPLFDVNLALNGLPPKCDRDHAYDYSAPERFEECRPVMETVLGIVKFNSARLQREFFEPEVGAFVLTKEMRALVAARPDKAHLIPGLIRDRDFTHNEISKIGELLDTVTAPLLEGTL